jgi:ketol-acid reductoisomerase
MQQAILPAVHHILTTAAHLLLARGYPPEAAMLDLYVSGELNDYMDRAAHEGLNHALRLMTLAGQYGIFSRLERFQESKFPRLMENILDEIRDRRFAKEWAREYADNYPRLRKLLTQQEKMDLWELEQQTIDLLRKS